MRNWKRVARRHRRYLARGNWTAENWTRYGHALKQSGELSSAAHAYAMAVSLETDSLSDVHLQVGYLHEVQGEMSKAVQSYKSALKYNPENLDAVNGLRAHRILEEEITSIVEGAREDRHSIGLHPADRVLAARFKGGPSAKRSKWGPVVAAMFILLCLFWGGASMLAGPRLEIVQNAYRSAVAEMRRLTGLEDVEAEVAARKAAEEKASTAAVARRAAEEKTLIEAASRKVAEGKALAEAAARKAAEERALVEAAERKAASEKALSEAAARRVAEQKLAAEDARLKAEALKTAEGKLSSDVERREQAERAEASLNLSEQDRKRVQVELDSLGHEIPTVTGYFGPRTRAMITAWQKRQGLVETGYLDGSQLAALHEQAALAKGADEAKIDVRQQAERAEAGLNLSEQDRKRVQVALNSLGHEIPTATGYFGPRTRAMITAWQKAQGLPGTGYLTEAQLATLRQQAAPALAKFDQAQTKPKDDSLGAK